MQLAAVAKPQVVVPGGREGLVFLPAKLVQQLVNLEFAEMYICELLPESWLVAEGSDNVGGEAKINKSSGFIPQETQGFSYRRLVWVFGYGGCSVH